MAGMVRIRLYGDPGDIAAVLMAAARVMEVMYDGRWYPGRGGVRAYADVRARHRVPQMDEVFADLARIAKQGEAK